MNETYPTTEPNIQHGIVIFASHQEGFDSTYAVYDLHTDTGYTAFGESGWGWANRKFLELVSNYKDKSDDTVVAYDIRERYQNWRSRKHSEGDYNA